MKLAQQGARMLCFLSVFTASIPSSSLQQTEHSQFAAETFGRVVRTVWVNEGAVKRVPPLRTVKTFEEKNFVLHHIGKPVPAMPILMDCTIPFQPTDSFSNQFCLFHRPCIAESEGKVPQRLLRNIAPGMHHHDP
mmetsp:Transcript_51092/g.108544  ORF Transcript_51092/g.108544 Transcript_51092/m.108544 type:complete len:135 (-) Transcript_51092:606-1010(-)